MPQAKYFPFYRSYRDVFAHLSTLQAGELISRLIAFFCDEPVEESTDPAVAMSYLILSSQIERDLASFADKCEAEKEGGRKGMEKEKEKENKKKNEIDMETEWEKKRDGGSASPAVPCPAPAPPDEQAIKELLRRGVPAQYLYDRLDRATFHAAKSGDDPLQVLLGWWHRDRVNYAPERRPRVGELGNSFDTDDMMEAALRRSLREAGILEDPDAPIPPSLRM